ncbi:MAG: PQQ-binding-like beta-propeller repeat protein [Ignavibacteriae bacterium]|nr:PQQ-binding-like beta-propeller repeat protein [Ignavibacteriota bacterium]
MSKQLSFFLVILAFIMSGRSVSQTNSFPDFETQPTLSWKYPTNSPIIGSPVINEQTVYVGNTDGTLYALNLNDGKEVWKFPTYGPIRSTVCIEKEKLFLLSGDGNLYCVNKLNGSLLWRFKTFTGYIGDRKYDFADYYASSPLLYEKAIYFGCSDGRIYALNTENGTLLWSYETGDIVHTKPAISQGKLFAGSFDGNVYALNINTGALVWKFKSVGHRYFPTGEVTGNPAVTNNLVLIGARDYHVYAIEQNGGYCYWTKQFPKGWALPITVLDTVAYIGTSDDRELVAVDARTGETIWKANAKFNIFGGCSFTATMGYFGTLSGNLFGFDLKSGAVKWNFTVDGYSKNHLNYLKDDDTYRDDIGSILTSNDAVLTMYNDLGAIFSTPAVTEDKLVITSSDGNVYCLRK